VDRVGEPAEFKRDVDFSSARENPSRAESSNVGERGSRERRIESLCDSCRNLRQTEATIEYRSKALVVRCSFDRRGNGNGLSIRANNATCVEQDLYVLVS